MSITNQQQPDNVADSLDNAWRMALIIAARGAEIAVSRRAGHLAQEEAASTDRVREAQRRIEAELEAARFVVARTRSESWWNRVTPERVAHAWEAAATWRDRDLYMGEAAKVLAGEIKTRLDIDVTELRPDGPGMQARVEEALRLREEAVQAAQTARPSRPRRRGQAPDGNERYWPWVDADSRGRAREPAGRSSTASERPRARGAEHTGQGTLLDQEALDAVGAAHAGRRDPAGKVARPPTQSPKARRAPGTVGRGHERDKTMGR